MKILITNDDGYTSKGIHSLVEIMKQFGDVTVLAPKHHQSAMSMAVSIGRKPVVFKDLGMVDGARWMYMDGTPASCAKYAMDVLFADDRPDVILSGINHGINASTAMWYSATIGAAREGSLAKVSSIAVSLDNLSPEADFTVVEKLFPDIFRKLIANVGSRKGKTVYNVNFPNIPADQVKGVRMATQGSMSWVEEFVSWSESGLPLPELEEGETCYMMAGKAVNDPENGPETDSVLLEQGYVTITPQSMDNTDYEELERLSKIIG